MSILKNTFNNKYNRFIVVSSIVICTVIYIYFLLYQDKKVFPDLNEFSFKTYNDSADGGKSEVTSLLITDSVIIFDFTLKKGFFTPYVGMNLFPKKDSVINLSSYNQCCIDIKGMGIKNIGIYFFTRNKYNTKSKEICFYENIEITSNRNQYTIDLSRLKVPDWWLLVNNFSPNEIIKPDLKHITSINIGNAYTPILNVKSSLKIYSISFERNNVKLVLFLISFEIMLLILLIIIQYAKSKKKGVSITIAYKPVDTENESNQLNSFLEYINNNFNDLELTLEKVSNQTGIYDRRIANYIQDNFGCNFKTYINQLRINESKRLLKETELNMGEIAFKVGFSNQSHFNRVFKNIVLKSPSEFREQQE